MALDKPTRGELDWDAKLNDVLEQLDGKETPDVSQAKATAAYMAAVEYIDTLISQVSVIEGAQGPEGPQGPPGGAGPQGPPGEVTYDYLDTALPASFSNETDAQKRKRLRAMRNFHVALASVATTAVDIVVGPSDSIGAGAWASNWRNTFTNVMRDKLRRGVQPSGVAGGAGYQFLGNTFLGGGPVFSSTGSTSVDTTNGFGRTSIVFQPAATLTIFGTITQLDIVYTKGGGSFTYTIDGGSASAPVSTAGSGHGKTTISGLSAANHTIVFTFSGSAVTVEGVAAYNGDETTGVRVWNGSHAGYTAHDYVTSVEWAESLSLIPNPQLLVLPIGSNDYYTGRPVADAKADILSIIALERTKLGANISIALMCYYERPSGGAIVPWSSYVAMYKEIADADDNIALLDLGPVFGPMLSDTDSRGGLTTASPGDYVHPTNAGHALIGEALTNFILPEGAHATGGVFNNTPDASKPVSTAQAAADLVAAAGLPYTAIGNFGGAMSFAALPIGNFSLTATGNLSLPVSGMPVVSAGRTATWYLRVTQDGTGSRTLTLDALIKFPGAAAPVLQTAAGAIDLLEFKFDGISWWVRSCSNPTVSTTQAAADVAAAGGLAYTAVGNFGGAMAFQALPLANYSLTATGNLTLAPSGMPPVTAGRTATWYLRILQDGTGSRTLTLDPAILTSGITPVLQTAAGSVDLLEFYFDGITWWARNAKADPDLVTIAGLTATTDNVIQSVAGAWASRTMAQLKTTLALVKGDVGLGNVDNTSDVNKPVSTAQQTAITAAQDAGNQGVVVTTINNFSGAMNFASFTPILGKEFVINLTGNATFNTTGIPALPSSRGGSFHVTFVQDATGSRTLTLTSFKRAGGAFALSTGANARDLVEFFNDGTNWWIIPKSMNGS